MNTNYIMVEPLNQCLDWFNELSDFKNIEIIAFTFSVSETHLSYSLMVPR